MGLGQELELEAPKLTARRKWGTQRSRNGRSRHGNQMGRRGGRWHGGSRG